jgi:RNA polymerase sigma factor (sigma-70 family)
MAVRLVSRLVERFHNVLLKQDGVATDADLLSRFLHQKDEAAFEAPVRKHGPMVLGVCQRILRNSHDAEDAFQASFLVLVRKAASIHPPGSVGNWLYGVAYRTAQEAKKSAAKRRAKEANVVRQTETPTDTWDDLRPVLDRELERLPEKYRAVIVLCDLEGKTRKEAAKQLGWPEGTVAGRVATARRMLAKRLTRHGFGVSAGVLSTMLGQHASAAVSPSVESATVNSAVQVVAGHLSAISVDVAAMVHGVEKSMLLSKVKLTAAVLVLGFILGGGGLLTLATFGAGQSEAPQVAQRKEEEKQPDAKDKAIDVEAQARLEQAQAAYKIADANLKDAQRAVPEAAAMLRLKELREGLREQRTNLLLLALALEKQKGRLRLMKERLEFVLKRAVCNDEEKKLLTAAVKQEVDPLIEKTIDVAERIDVLRLSNDEMFDMLAQGDRGMHRQRLQLLKKELQSQNEYCDWPERQLDRVRESLRGFVKVGLERSFNNSQLNNEDKSFLVETLKKEIDPIVSKADEIERILGRVRARLLESLGDEQKGTKLGE